MSTTLVSITHGSATLPKAVGASGVPVRTCSYCNLDNVRTWAQTLESLFTLHPYSHPTCLYLPASAEVRATSLQQESTVAVPGLVRRYQDVSVYPLWCKRMLVEHALTIQSRHTFQNHGAHDIWPSANTNRTDQWECQTLCIYERRSSGC